MVTLTNMIMVVIACSLIQAPSQMLSGYQLQDHDCKII